MTYNIVHNIFVHAAMHPSRRVYSGLVNLLPHIKKEDARAKSRRPVRRSELACKVALGTIAQNEKGRNFRRWACEYP